MTTWGSPQGCRGSAAHSESRKASAGSALSLACSIADPGRLSALTRGGGYFAVGAACIVIAAATPLMEAVPFSANISGMAIVAYGLALMCQTAFALIATAFSAGAFCLIGRRLLSS